MHVGCRILRIQQFCLHWDGLAQSCYVNCKVAQVGDVMAQLGDVLAQLGGVAAQ
jgi:hypothetical protein